MAQDLDVGLPFAGVDVNEAQWNEMFRWLVDGPIRGELSDFAVTTASGRNVTVGAGRCWIEGKYGELSAAFTQPIATNTSGNPRIDRVVLRLVESAKKLRLDVLTGTPSGSPVAPALTQNSAIWEISLAQIAVANGFSAITGGNITDERRFSCGRPPGGPAVIACAVTISGSPAITIAPGAAQPLILSGSAGATEDYDTAGIHSLTTNPNRYVIPGGCGGLWTVGARLAWVAGAVDTSALELWVNGSMLRVLDQVTDVGGSHTYTLDGESDEALNAGDIVVIYAVHSSGSDENISDARVWLRYLGSLAA